MLRTFGIRMRPARLYSPAAEVTRQPLPMAGSSEDAFFCLGSLHGCTLAVPYGRSIGPSQRDRAGMARYGGYVRPGELLRAVDRDKPITAEAARPFHQSVREIFAIPG